MIDGPGPNLYGTAQEPQVVDYRAKAFGYGILFGVVGLSTASPAGAEYQFGTHQTAIYESQFKGVIFHPPHPNIPGDAVKAFTAGPQQYDFTQQATIAQACISINQSIAISAEYQFGTHAVQLANSQIQPQVWPPPNRPFTSNDLVPIRSIHVQGQELTRDLTIQGSFPFVPVSTGWLLTMVSAGPQLVDLTAQAAFQQAPIHNVNAPWCPTTIVSVMQADPWQRQAQVYKPSARAFAPQQQITIIAAPLDAVQFAAQACVSTVFPSTNKESLLVQPVQLQIPQQSYADISFIFFAQPLVGSIIPPLPPLQYPVPVPYSIYADNQPWRADTNRYTVDSAQTIWSADGGGNGGGTSQPPVSNNPNSPKPPKRERLSITQTLNTKY